MFTLSSFDWLTVGLCVIFPGKMILYSLNGQGEMVHIIISEEISYPKR